MARIEYPGGNKSANPLLVVSPEEVLAWLYDKATEVGLDHGQSCVVQINVQRPFVDGATFHFEIPSLVMMCSNVLNKDGTP